MYANQTNTIPPSVFLLSLFCLFVSRGGLLARRGPFFQKGGEAWRVRREGVGWGLGLGSRVQGVGRGLLDVVFLVCAFVELTWSLVGR